MIKYGVRLEVLESLDPFTVNGNTILQVLVGTFDYYITDSTVPLNNFWFAHFTSDVETDNDHTDIVVNSNSDNWYDLPNDDLDRLSLTLQIHLVTP